MENNDIPSIVDALDTDVPSDEAILAALSGEEITEDTEIIEESEDSTDVTEPTGDDSDMKSILDAAKEELQNDESGEDQEDEGVEEAPEEEGDAKEESTEEESQDETEAFEVKVDGEVQKVTLQDLKNDYSGRKAVAQRFTELDKERKEFYNEKAQVEGYIDNFSSKIKDGDALGAFSYLAEFSGTPPYLLKEQLIAAIRPEVERRYNLSEQQQQKELLSAELEHMKAQKESETKRQSQKQTLEELQNSINSVRETHGITEDTWNKAFAALDQEVPSDQEITIEQVQAKSIELKADDLSTNILSEFDEVPGDAKDALKNIILENPNFTEDDLKDIVKASLDQAKQNADEAKAKEMGKKLKGKVKPVKAKSAKSKENNNSQINGVNIPVIEDWDDIL